MSGFAVGDRIPVALHFQTQSAALQPHLGMRFETQGATVLVISAIVLSSAMERCRVTAGDERVRRSEARCLCKVCEGADGVGLRAVHRCTPFEKQCSVLR